MSTMKLTAEVRAEGGKGVARKLRAKERIPGILYGKHRESTPITLSTDEVTRLLSRGRATMQILDLELQEGGKSSQANVLIKEIQTHPYRDHILHLDLMEVSMTEKVSVKVPVKTTGESPGVKMGGIMEFKRRELEVSCLPGRIPASLVVDISALEIGDSVHVKDITPPEGVTIPYDVNYTILTVVGAAAEPEPVAAAAAEAAVEGAEAPAEPTEPELIRKVREKEPEEEKK